MLKQKRNVYDKAVRLFNEYGKLMKSRKSIAKAASFVFLACAENSKIKSYEKFSRLIPNLFKKDLYKCVKTLKILINQKLC
mmetsp:Transcript_7370/g.10311  ORF Transcript_7370/g.10311 Transcript_7370/m.10311 type:complete len:81 (+) Transcript_7370:750-992(+)